MRLTMAHVLSDDIPEQTSWLQKLGIAIEVIAPGLALITVIGRLYIRTKMKNLGWGELEGIQSGTGLCG